ncbi:soluble guanylate cyclase 89Da-like [Paramacrobiotus metropolitanus]|uniref:soluble guanylate cyclase 89Da-like n=1 Tax=Paramacrobiotus metropolitanus TaxID=2943436 RepID=UPI002445D3E3|nr:soluble guanylate cyclase 89Da-like [Paramacrobiotus metropolitanus]
MFVSFDDIVSLYDVYKVETINDSCMVASGLPERNEDRHAKEICHCALGFRKKFLDIGKSHDLAIKIGINTGPCVAGIVGKKRPRYCLFGDTINTASRVASNNTDWTIQITATTWLLIRETNILAEHRGKIFLKGKGEWEVYCLL